MRFGSITEFSTVKRSWMEIGKRVMINSETIRRAVTKYISNNCTIVKTKHRRGKARKLSPELEREIVSIEKLKEYRFLTIKERCARILTEYGISLSDFTLKKYYRDNNIRFRQPKVVQRLSDNEWINLI